MLKEFLKSIRDKLQRTIFNQERIVLEVLANSGKWLTYIEVSFYSKGRVSSDNALTALYTMRDDGRVDFSIKRNGAIGSYWNISINGREWLNGRSRRK